MSAFEEMDNYLAEEMSLSYWSDEGIDVAAKLVAGLAPAASQRCVDKWPLMMRVDDDDNVIGAIRTFF